MFFSHTRIVHRANVTQDVKVDAVASPRPPVRFFDYKKAVLEPRGFDLDTSRPLSRAALVVRVSAISFKTQEFLMTISLISSVDAVVADISLEAALAVANARCLQAEWRLQRLILSVGLFSPRFEDDLLGRPNLVILAQDALMDDLYQAMHDRDEVTGEHAGSASPEDILGSLGLNDDILF
tara:strand:+ start:503 stop:1045 length:543 start_codon:yes stop_codon:yes gene_type:complete